MGEPLRAAVAASSYMLAVVASLTLFLFSLSRVLSAPQVRPAGIAAAVAAGLGLLFAIGGGYLWFRFLLVVQPA